jgi:hypothetical protein
MRALLVSLIMVTTGCFVAAPALADAYKWTDEKGQIHYTQSPPAGVDAIEVITPSGSASAVAPAAKPAAASPAATDAEGTTQENDALRKQLAAEKERLKLNCEVAQHNVKVLSVVGNRPYKDEKGNVVQLSEDQRKAQLDEAQKQIEAFCDKGEAKPNNKPD